MKELGFNRNHFLVGLTALALFAVLVFSKTGITLSAMFTNADDSQPLLTYEQAKGEVYAQMGIVDAEKYLQDLENQFALLDRGQVDGAVLGQAIGIGAVPSSEQIFTREMLDQIPVIKSSDNSREAIQRYSELLLGAEAESGAMISIANLNSSDPLVLNQAKESAAQAVSNLKSLSVPSELADFHRYKMIYYQNLAAIADSLINPDATQDLQNQTSIFLSITERINQIKSDIWDKLQVQL